MEFSKEKHIDFLESELKQQTSNYLTKINNKAIYLMQKEEIYSTQFVSFKDGQMILRFKNERGIPRKGDYFTAILFKDEKKSFKNWGNINWSNLRKEYQVEYTEVVHIWNTSDENNAHCSLVGFRGVDVDFAEKLVENCIVILGPKAPPFEYIKNLISVVEETDKSNILDFDIKNLDWNPKKLNNENPVETILSELQTSNEIIIQGPPGTGKTYLMSEFIAKLLSQNKSILVTALTNRALMELASKEPLKPFLEKGVIYKSNLKVDEQREIKQLKNATETVVSSGCLMLATFYKSSKIAIEFSNNTSYDYVILDEASQALLAMFEVATLLGKKNIWIGDPFQLPPIVEINDKIIKKRNLKLLINGMETICKNIPLPFYILSNSYRLTERAVKYTGIFYNNNLQSCSPKDFNIALKDSKSNIPNFIHPGGGPVLITTSFEVGEYSPKNGITLIVDLVKDLQSLYGTKVKIAILTKFRRSAKEIQKNIVKNNKHILIDTVEKVQGLTCDITIFFIPNKYIRMSLNRAIFNVATSRSTGSTLIIADESILSEIDINSDVKKYLSTINNDVDWNTSRKPENSKKVIELLNDSETKKICINKSKRLVELLSNFTRDTPIKYTTHLWDSGELKEVHGGFDGFMRKVDGYWNGK